jgi:hypothetical protein
MPGSFFRFKLGRKLLGGLRALPAGLLEVPNDFIARMYAALGPRRAPGNHFNRSVFLVVEFAARVFIADRECPRLRIGRTRPKRVKIRTTGGMGDGDRETQRERGDDSEECGIYSHRLKIPRCRYSGNLREARDSHTGSISAIWDLPAKEAFFPPPSRHRTWTF